MRRLLICGCLAALAPGCGGGKDGQAPVSGVVKVDGAPAANVTVRFYPDGDTDPTSSGYSQTDLNGTYVITGANNKKGLVPGRYKVTVTKGAASAQNVESSEGAGAVVPGIETKDEFPPAYSDPAKTKLAYSVTGDGKSIDINIELKKK